MENIKEIILNTFKDVNSLDKLEKNIKKNSNELIPLDLQNKFKGDIFELFINFYINAFKYHPSLQLRDYKSGSPFGEDTGSDGWGIGPDNNICFVQIKYRSNKEFALDDSAHLENVINDKNIYYNNLLKDCTCENEHSKILKAKNENYRVFYFTNSSIKHKTASNLLSDSDYKKYIFDYDKINELTKNNPGYWIDLYKTILETDFSYLFNIEQVVSIPNNKIHTISSSGNKNFDDSDKYNQYYREFINIINKTDSLNKFIDIIINESFRFKNNQSILYLNYMWELFINHFIFKTKFRDIKTFENNYTNNNIVFTTKFSLNEYLTSNSDKLAKFNIDADKILDNELKNNSDFYNERFKQDKKIIFTNAIGIHNYTNEKMVRNEILCIGINEIKNEIKKINNFFNI